MTLLLSKKRWAVLVSLLSLPRYLGAYVVCPLDKDPYPLAVSVVTANSTVTGTYMFIHYSSNITSAPSDKNSHYMEKRRWNVTRCFPAFQQQYNNHNLLSEIVAASVVLGVDHFMFYIESVGPEVNRTLQVEMLIPWVGKVLKLSFIIHSLILCVCMCVWICVFKVCILGGLRWVWYVGTSESRAPN